MFVNHIKALFYSPISLPFPAERVEELSSSPPPPLLPRQEKCWNGEDSKSLFSPPYFFSLFFFFISLDLSSLLSARRKEHDVCFRIGGVGERGEGRDQVHAVMGEGAGLRLYCKNKWMGGAGRGLSDFVWKAKVKEREEGKEGRFCL